jgi:hypothetical protein
MTVTAMIATARVERGHALIAKSEIVNTKTAKQKVSGSTVQINVADLPHGNIPLSHAAHELQTGSAPPFSRIDHPDGKFRKFSRTRKNGRIRTTDQTRGTTSIAAAVWETNFLRDPCGSVRALRGGARDHGGGACRILENCDWRPQKNKDAGRTSRQSGAAINQVQDFGT